VILLFGLTGPVSILLAPLFVWRAWYRRSPASCVLAALALTTGAVQAWTVWQNPTPVSDQPIAMDALLTVPGMRVAGSLLAGYFVPWDYPRAIETLLGIATLLAVVALAARQGVARLERTWLALVFVALLASALYRCRFVLPDLRHATFGSRYFFPLQLIVVWLVLAAATDARRWLARSAALLALWSLVINLPRLREPALTDFHWADYVGKLRAGEAVDVPVNPAPWVVTFPAKKP
jgi:hypothetical protein